MIKRGICAAWRKRSNTQYYPKAGWVEHDPHEIWSSQMSVMKEAMGKIGADVADIDSIGITNQRETTIVWIRLQEIRFILPLYGSAEGRPGWWRSWKKKDSAR